MRAYQIEAARDGGFTVTELPAMWFMREPNRQAEVGAVFAGALGECLNYIGIKLGEPLAGQIGEHSATQPPQRMSAAERQRT